jgi:hypothetical protein
MRAALAVLVLAAIVVPAQAQDAGLHAAAEGFYGVYKTFHPSDGIPDAKDRAKYAPYLSPKLDTLLQQAGDAQAAFLAKHKDSPPMVEGDLFSSLFEGATAASIGACTGDAQKGQCAADLRYEEPGQKPTIWTDTVYLVNTPQGWRVDDIGYGGNWAFGNKGRLSETLGQAIHFQ